MDASRTEAFCTRSCPFSSLSSSFMSKSLQSWTRNVSRNASESGWKRSNRRSRKTPVHPREPRVAAVSDFPDTAGRRTHRKPENRTLRRRAGEQEILPKPSAAASVERGDAAEWTRPAACGGARDMELASTKSRINGWRRNRRFSCSQQPAVRTVSRGCAGAAIGACLEKITRGWRQEAHKCRRFKGFRRATPQIGGL